MSSERRSIPTRYKGILFRSKLEADWARFFDAIGLAWQYEKEGRYFGEVFYLPDFYLPRSRQHVEVKGAWTPDDVRKLGAFLNHIEPRPHTGDADNVSDLTLVCCQPSGAFWGYIRPRVPLDLAVLDALLLDHNRYTYLAQCVRCRGWWFLDITAGYRCQCCGAWDGDHHIGDAFPSPIEPWPPFRRAA